MNIREHAESAVATMIGPPEALGGEITDIEMMPEEFQLGSFCFYRAVLDNGYWMPFAVPKDPPQLAEKNPGVEGPWCRRCGGAVDLGREHHFFGPFGLAHWGQRDCELSQKT